MQEIDNLYIYEFADGFSKYAGDIPSAILEGMTWSKNTSHPHWAHEEPMPYSPVWRSITYDYGGSYFPPIKEMPGTDLDTSGQWLALGNTFPLARLSTTDSKVLTVSWKSFPKNWQRYVLLKKAPAKGPHVAHFQKYSFEHLSGDNRLGGGKVSADARRARYKFNVEGKTDQEIVKNLRDQVEAHLKQIRSIVAKGPSSILEPPPCKYSLPDKKYPEHDYQNGYDLTEEQLQQWLAAHKADLQGNNVEPDSILPGACPECGGTTHFIENGSWVCGECDYVWKGAETEENPETGQDIFELTEFQDSRGHKILATGYQEKKIRRGNRKEPLLSWPEELKLIKRLYPRAVADRLAGRESPDRTTAERLMLIRYCSRQGGMSDKSIAQQFKQRGRIVAESTIKSDRHRLDKIIEQVAKLKADSGSYFTLPEVADKTGIPEPEVSRWLEAGWVEGTSIDAEGEGLEIYPWWILSLKQMVTLADKWEKRAEPVVL